MELNIKTNFSIILFSSFVFLSCCTSQPTEMAYIPGGSFQMGIDSVLASMISNKYPDECDFSWFNSQMPKHEVVVKPFNIDKYEVTFAKYFEFEKKSGYKSGGKWNNYYHFLKDTLKRYNADLYPVFGITWEDANAFAKWHNKRLPSEEEWEFVAKGGKCDFIYPWGNTFNSHLARVQKKEGPVPVGSFEPNKYQVYDLGGNVPEWCANFYRGKNNSIHNNTDDSLRVIRGGASFLNWPYYSLTTTRFSRKKENISFWVGFRCAKSINK